MLVTSSESIYVLRNIVNRIRIKLTYIRGKTNDQDKFKDIINCINIICGELFLNNKNFPSTFLDGEPIKLPDNLESLPRADHFPTQRHRWNTNEVRIFYTIIEICSYSELHSGNLNLVYKCYVIH